MNYILFIHFRIKQEDAPPYDSYEELILILQNLYQYMDYNHLFSIYLEAYAEPVSDIEAKGHPDVQWALPSRDMV